MNSDHILLSFNGSFGGALRGPEEPEKAAAEPPHDVGEFGNVIRPEGIDKLPAQV
jgi:hypothetical protein